MSAASWISLAQAIVAAALTIITVIYVVYTRMLAKTAAAQLEAQARPYVLADLVVMPSSMVLLRVRNTGLSAAQKLTLSLDREIKTVNDRKLNDLPPFTTGLPQLLPGGEITWMLGTSHNLIEELPAIAVTAQYEYAAHKYSESCELSLEGYAGTNLPPKSETAKEVEELRKELAKVSAALKTIADRPKPLPPLGPW